LSGGGGVFLGFVGLISFWKKIIKIFTGFLKKVFCFFFKKEIHPPKRKKNPPPPPPR